MTWTGTPLLLHYNKYYLFETVPRSFVLLHNFFLFFFPSFFFFYRCVQTRCFLNKCNQNRSCFSPYSSFPPKDIQTVFYSTCSKCLASPRATQSHFRFPSKNVLKIIVFSRTYAKVPLFSSSVICQTTGPKPLPKRFLHLVRCRASSFN